MQTWCTPVARFGEPQITGTVRRHGWISRTVPSMGAPVSPRVLWLAKGESCARRRPAVGIEESSARYLKIRSFSPGARSAHSAAWPRGKRMRSRYFGTFSKYRERQAFRLSPSRTLFVAVTPVPLTSVVRRAAEWHGLSAAMKGHSSPPCSGRSGCGSAFGSGHFNRRTLAEAAREPLGWRIGGIDLPGKVPVADNRVVRRLTRCSPAKRLLDLACGLPSRN
jgi:hypothetical protein